MAASINKRFRYQILDYKGNFITEWTDVITDPDFSWEINNGPGELRVKLARTFSNFGEGKDVAFENRLNLYAIDREAPMGVLIYSGRLNEISPHFGRDGEWVEVQFLGYASTLNDQIARDRAAIDVDTHSANSKPFVVINTLVTSQYDMIMSPFQPNVNNISGLQVFLGKNSNPALVSPTMTAGVMYADMDINHNYNIEATVPPTTLPKVFIKPGNILASGVYNTANITSSLLGTLAPVTIPFASTLTLDQSKQYFAYVSGSGISTLMQFTNDTAFGTYTRSDGTTGVTPLSYIFNASTVNPSGTLQYLQWAFDYTTPVVGISFRTLFDTSAPLYTNVDPTTIAQDLVSNKYTGPIVFDSANSVQTGSQIIYQFNRQTYKAALDRLVEMAPPYWYYVIRPDNTMRFVPRNDVVLDHTLVLGKHITQLDPIHSVDELQTKVVLYGGSDPGNSELVYIDNRPGMQPRYTIKEHIVRDSRVHKVATARLFTRDYLDFYGNPSTMMTLTVMDSNGDGNNGYDIESFVPGQRVLVVDPRTDGAKNFQGTGDNINLDGSVMDGFNDYILAAPLQIMKIEYKSESAILTLANRPVTAPRKIDDISQNLVQSQMANSPIV